MATARVVEEKVYTKTEKVVLVMSRDEAKYLLLWIDNRYPGIRGGKVQEALREALEDK